MLPKAQWAEIFYVQDPNILTKVNGPKLLHPFFLAQNLGPCIKKKKENKRFRGGLTLEVPPPFCSSCIHAKTTMQPSQSPHLSLSPLSFSTLGREPNKHTHTHITPNSLHYSQESFIFFLPNSQAFSWVSRGFSQDNHHFLVSLYTSKFYNSILMFNHSFKQSFQ